MIKTIKFKIKKNYGLIGLIFLILITVTSTSYYNLKKNYNQNNYINFYDNVFFKKTLKYLVDNLEPKFSKIKHEIININTKT